MPRYAALILGVLGVSVAFAAAPAAQPIDDLPHSSPDIETLSDAEALELVRQGAIHRWDVAEVIQRVARSGDPTFRPALREIAERYAPPYHHIVHNALFALKALGEPDAYFLANAQALPPDPDDDDLAYYSITVLSQDPDSTTWAEIEPLGDATSNADLQEAVRSYGSILSGIAEDERTVDVDSLIHRALNGVAFSYPWDTVLEGNTRDLDGSEFTVHRALNPVNVYFRRLLADLARRYPSRVTAAIGEIPTWEEFDVLAPYITPFGPSKLGEVISAVQAYADSVVFEVEVPVLPPVREDAAVVPRLECVDDEAAGSFVARFSYANAEGEAVLIPYGAANRLTPAAYDGRQPEGFPDSTGTFGVRFQAGETLEWTLAGETTVAATDAAALRCE